MAAQKLNTISSKSLRDSPKYWFDGRPTFLPSSANAGRVSGDFVPPPLRIRHLSARQPDPEPSLAARDVHGGLLSRAVTDYVGVATCPASSGASHPPYVRRRSSPQPAKSPTRVEKDGEKQIAGDLNRIEQKGEPAPKSRGSFRRRPALAA